MQISLFDSLKIGDKRVISIIGGGGKTSTMFSLAKEIKSFGKKVAVTTSTHIMKPNPSENDGYIVVSNPTENSVKEAFEKENMAVFGNNHNEKYSAPPDDFFDYILNYADYVLVEADGAKRLPFKAPREGEPIFVKNNQFTIIVAGLTAVDKPINEKCHRANILCNIINKNETDILTAEDMGTVITSPKGQLKDISSLDNVAVILNQADDDEMMKKAEAVSKVIFKNTGLKPIFTTLNKPEKVKKIYMGE